MAKARTKRYWAIVIDYGQGGGPSKLIGPFGTKQEAVNGIAVANIDRIASVVPIDVPQRKEKSR